MAEEPQFLILKTQNWLPITERSILGAVVKNILDPTSDYVPEHPFKYYTKSTIEKTYEDFILRSGYMSSRVGKVELTKLFGIKWGGKDDESFDLKGKLLQYKRIKQHEAFWKKLEKDESVKERVPAWFRFGGPPICVVTGLFMCENVDVATNDEEFNQLKANGQAPVGSILVSAATGLPIQVGDMAVAGGSDTKRYTYFRAKSKGKSIFAIELKVLEKKDGKLKWTGKNAKLPRGSRQLASDDGEDDIDINDLELKEIDAAEWGDDWEKLFLETDKGSIDVTCDFL